MKVLEDGPEPLYVLAATEQANVHEAGRSEPSVMHSVKE